MKPNDPKTIRSMLCKKQCLATEIATAIIYAAAILPWAGMPGFSNKSRNKIEPGREQHVLKSTPTPRMRESWQALRL